MPILTLDLHLCMHWVGSCNCHHNTKLLALSFFFSKTVFIMEKMQRDKIFSIRLSAGGQESV